MIRIKNNYNIIGFISFLKKNYETLSIDEIAENYMIRNYKNWNLNLFIKLFQDYLVNRNIVNNDKNDYSKYFYEFCNDIDNLKYIDLDSIYKRPFLQPMLYNYIRYLKFEKKYNIINEKLLYIAKYEHEKEYGFINWFNTIINEFSPCLIICYEKYMENSIYTSYINQFDLWLENKNKYLVSENLIIDKFLRSNRKEILIEIAKSNIPIINDCQILHNIVNVKEYEYIDFFEFLDNQFKINKVIPNYNLDDLINEYCEMNYGVKKANLKKFVNGSMNNKNQLQKLLAKYRNKSFNDFSIERYYSCNYHGLLLFESSKKFKDFLSNYIKDIHFLTGNTLDIYFTQEDLKRNISCYEKIEQLCFFEIEKGNVPCLLLWNHDIHEIQNIMIDGLEHDEIFDVIKVIVTSLEINKSLNESALCGLEKIKKIKESKIPIINNFSINNSQIGVVGDNNTVSNIEFKEK